MTTYFHYTNIQTFEAIVKSGFWRFSSLEDANDKRERYSNLNDDIFAECHYICASRNNTNAALWHHYANKHNGVCIEIEISSKDWKPTEIKYDGKRQDLNDASITIDEAREYLTHKSHCWRYEDEIRLFFNNTPCKDNEGYIGIKDGLKLIKSVTIGNGVKYNQISENAIRYLKSLNQKNALFAISWNQGEGNIIENLSPILQDRFNKLSIQ